MTKPSITKRSVKGAALTYNELDTNFQNLADATTSLTAGSGGTAVVADLNGNITLVAGSGISLSGNNTSKEITITSTSASNTFSTIAVSGQSNVVADSTSDTLTLVAGSNVTLTTDASSDSVTIAASVTGLTNPLNADLDLGSYKIKDTSGVATISTSGLKIESTSGSDSIQIAPNGTGLYTIDCADNKDLTIRTFVSGSVGARITLDHDTGVNIGTGDVTRAISLSDGALHIASLTTTQRNTISPINGMIIYNSSTNALQAYINSSWVTISSTTTNAPAFSAYATNTLQTITSGGQQKVLFQTEEFDTNNNYSSSRFTPTVEGYYQLNASVRIDGSTGTGEIMIILYKNGSEYKRGTNQQGTQVATDFWEMNVSSIAYANGSTDYFEIYVQQTSGASRTVTAVASPAITYFNGCMVRGA